MADAVLHEILRCFGYYGFGSGYALAKFGPADDTRSVYCSRCPRTAPCWQRHRAEVRRLLPDFCTLSDQILAEGFNGPAYLDEWLKRTEQPSKNFVEPYITLMLRNHKGGADVALAGTLPVDGNRLALRWPLVRLEDDQSVGEPSDAR